jgi:hypothetical protein
MANSHVKVMVSGEAMQRLRSYLGQFANACDADFTTPLIGRQHHANKDAGRAVVTEDFLSVCDVYAVHEELSIVEAAKRLKHGTFSRRPSYGEPDSSGVSLESKVEKYFLPHPVQLRHKSAQYADAFVHGVFPGRKRLVPLSLVDSVNCFFGKTGLGFPEFASSREYLPIYDKLSAMIVCSGYDLAYAGQFPAVIGTRTQASGPGKDAKARAVFQMSRVIGNLEKQLQAPLFEALRWQPQFAAWGGRRYVDIAVTKFMTSAKGKVLSLDFSNFDATVPFEVIDRVYRILEKWFIPAAKPLIDFCREAFKRSGILVPGAYRDGAARLGGIPSGSVMTNLIGSLVNMWVIAYATHRCGGRIMDCTVQGDDGLYRFQGIHEVTPLAEMLLSELGMIMSTDVSKSLYASGVCHYLQMVHSASWCKDGIFVGVRPLMHVLNGAMSRENVRTEGWYDLYHTVRWLQQFENASEHPKFGEACTWLASRDPNLKEVLYALLRDDDDFILAATRVLANGHLSYGKVPVSQLKWSSVVSTLCKLLGIAYTPRA